MIREFSRRRGLASIVGLLLAGLLAGCRPSVEEADLVLLYGNLVTVDSAMPVAQAVAIRGQWIEAVGSNREIRRYIGPNTEVLDLQSQLAVPGFIEGHGHFLSLGRARMMLDLTTAGTWDEVVAMVAAAAQDAQPGEWILGRGWHQDKWDPKPPNLIEGVPMHTALSRVSPRNPVHLTHASGHASIANARALAAAGITRATRNPPGGEIVRNAQREPTGLLRETAQRLVSAAHAHSQEGRLQQ